MSRVRALDAQGDWTFGKGGNNYKTGILAVAQNIKTRVSSFLGDCFFATNQGIDWFNLLGSKDPLGINIAVARTILNTPNVTGIERLYITLNDAREIRIDYAAQTSYSVGVQGDFSLDLPI